MRPIYESIITSSNTSFKVQSYDALTNCESAGWHIHPEYEMVYVKNGSGTIKIGNKIHEYKNGVLVFLGGNIPHSDFGNKQYANGKEVVVQFSKEFVEGKLSHFPEFSSISKLIYDSKYVFIFEDSTKAHLGSYFESFSELNRQEKLINLMSILNHLSVQKEYIQLFKPNKLIEFREKESYRLRAIFDYINNHYAQKITTQAISQEVGLTPNSFSRFFKNKTNKTFIDFVNEFRIGKAMDILNEGNVTIMEAMYQSGFRSPSYFAKQFYKYQKVSPSRYLKKINSL